MILTSYLLVKAAAFSPQEKTDDQYAQAAFLIDQGEYEEAIRIYRQLLKNEGVLDDYRKSRIYNNIGYCLYKLGHYEEAHASFLETLDLDGNYLNCLNNISAVLIKQGKYKEALEFLHRAHEIEPEHIKVIFNMFVAYANLNDENLARRFLSRAFEVDKSYTVQRLKMKKISDDKITKIENSLKTKKEPQP